MPKKTVTPQEMEHYARALQSARESGVLSAVEHGRLHVAFVATDYAAQRWSVGLRTGAWRRLDEGRWVAAEPPDRLHLDEALVAELELLSPYVAESTTVAPVMKGGVAPTSVPGQPAPQEPDAPVERHTGSRASTPTDWGPVVLCVAIAFGFAAGGWTRSSMGAYVLATFFAALAVFIVFLIQMPRRA